MAEREKLIELKDLQITFGSGKKKFVAVDHVNFDIYKGETFSLVGESGSGKTTIGRAICRINPTSGGDIFFKGQKINGKISKELDKEVIRKIQMIFQDPMASLNERAKVEYIIAEGLLNHHLYKDQEDLHEKVMNALHEVGLLPEFASRFPHEFSGGQRQRIGIARALVMEPEFIVADEPISALDVSIRAQVLNLLNEMKKSRGLTYLFIAHDLSVVRFISDRIAVISKGRIVELAEAEELFLHPLHPYTKALLSAVPIPDPALEKNKKLLVYDPSIHDYSVDKPVWEEIANGHFVYGNQRELEGYRKEYERTDASGNSTMVAYSPYSNGIYGYPSGSKQGLISMSVSNNLEMKVRSDRDSTGYRKISLIDELSASLSYNMAASRQPWSNLSTRLRLKLGKNKTFSMAAVFATYAYKFNENGQVVTSDRTEWSYGRFGRFQGMSQNLSYTLNNQTWNKLMDFLHGRRKADSSAKDNTADADADDVEDANVDPNLKTARKGGRKPKNKAKVDADGYLTFSMPWSLTLSYGITMAEDRSRQINVRRMRYPFSFTQTLNASGYLRIAEGWNISFSSGYDFEMHKLSMTTMSLSRDLHCFEMSANVVLKPYSSFNFTFRARASELADALKWEKRSSYSTNVEWY